VVCDDRALFGKALYMFRFFGKKGFWYEDGKVRVDVPCFLETVIEVFLDVLPDPVAVGLDHHTSANRRLVRQFTGGDNIEIPLRIVIRARGDALL
jgi:hypothetical protein